MGQPDHRTFLKARPRGPVLGTTMPDMMFLGPTSSVDVRHWPRAGGLLISFGGTCPYSEGALAALQSFLAVHSDACVRVLAHGDASYLHHMETALPTVPVGECSPRRMFIDLGIPGVPWAHALNTNGVVIRTNAVNTYRHLHYVMEPLLEAISCSDEAHP